MAFCTVKDILDSALSITPDNSDELRAKAVIWLNEVMRDILGRSKRWEFLRASTAITVVGNKITLPADFKEEISLQVGDYFFTPDNRLTEQEIDENDTGTVPVGYRRTASGEITFYPGATGTAVLTYNKGMTANYADDETATIFPVEFYYLLVLGVRKYAYQYDVEDLYPAAVQLYEKEMKERQHDNNLQKPIPRHRYAQGEFDIVTGDYR